MNKEAFTICFILEEKYQEIFDLPSKWDMLNINDKCELLSLAINNNKMIEELDKYKELINEHK